MTGKGEKQKRDETQLQGKGVCVCVCVSARAHPFLLCSAKRGCRSGQGASSNLESPVTIGGSRSHLLAKAVACPGPTPPRKHWTKLSVLSFLVASTCRSTPELAL